MNRKNIPLILMLIAGGVTCVITFVKRCTIVEKLTSLLLVLFLFFCLGSILKWTLDRFERQNQETEQKEGSVIEKEGEIEEQDNETTKTAGEGKQEKDNRRQ